MSDKIFLGIETSCDETSAAVVVNGRKVLSNVIASQTDIHQPFGGVVPEIAARKHMESISYIAREALRQAHIPLDEIDGVAVANGPGLAGALLVGLSFAKGLAFARGIDLVGVHHIFGHICALYLESDWKPPFVCLIVSGGHTHLVEVTDYFACRVLGRTRDDAAGEVFDKVGRALGLPYPAGPEIDRMVRLHPSSGDLPRFPRAKFAGSLDFSFSGLKTAVLQYIQKQGLDLSVADCATAFQQAVVEVLVSRTLQACDETGLTDVALAGGVAANVGLRDAMRDACQTRGLCLHMPAMVYCTDNAAMVAAGGYFRGETDPYNLNAYPGMKLDIGAI
jgi:N6-L-threonylcarbamoyladenine synthase